MAFVTESLSAALVLTPVKAPAIRFLESAPVPIAIPALPDCPLVPTVIPIWSAVALL